MLFCTFCQLKAFVQKGCISLFGPIFIPTKSSKILADWHVLTWKAFQGGFWRCMNMNSLFFVAATTAQIFKYMYMYIM